MCGIAGTYNFSSEDLIRRMAESIKHRGPDEQRLSAFDKGGFAFRRLSIIDLQTGSQPISSEDGSVVVMFNGEIYNYKELKQELNNHSFKTKSDTEVIVHLYEDLGERFVDKLNGQFAIALYDKRKEKLILVRDRLGIKPLYYTRVNNELIFASEIKAILQDKRVKREPNLTGINNFLKIRYVPGRESIIKNIYRLEPGSMMICSDSSFEIKRYWEPQVYQGSYKKDSYYLERFSELFEDSVKMRLMSDVPLGAYLSGGLDSSCIVSAMRKLGEVKAFSIGFDSKYDELSTAQKRASQIGVDLKSFKFSPGDFELFSKIIYHMDEPQGDAIMLPTYLLAKEASKEIKVALTGEGADEILGGYLYHKTIKLANSVPSFLRKHGIKPLVKILPSSFLDLFFHHPASLGKAGKKRLLNYLDIVGDIGKEYIFLTSLFEKDDMYTDSFKSQIVNNLKYEGSSFEDLLAMQYKYWLPDNILMRQDKMSMANSLEIRVPFLDHRLVEFLLKTPSHLKVRYLTDKYLLRRYSLKVLPEEVSKMKKKPFYIPIENYFTTGGFKKLVDMTLSESQVEKRGYFKYSYIKDLLDKLSKNEFLYAKQVMALIILELWHQMFIDNENFNSFLSV